jgi:hypothetical protein
MRDININIDAEADANQQPCAVNTYKFASDLTAETVTCGYMVDDIKISGNIRGWNYGINALDLFNNTGTFSTSLGTWTGETIRNFCLRDLTINSFSTAVLLNASAITTGEIKNVWSPSSGCPWTITGATSGLRIQNVSAQNVSEMLVRAIKKQVFTASGTYTPSTGLLYAIIECVGSGGGGGGANNASTTQIYGGGGGGSGSYSRLVATAATIGASQTVTIGAAGTGGAAGSNNGTAGADVSVGTLCIGKGGGGGNFSSIAQVPTGGGGGTSGTGDLAALGTSGGFGAYSTANNTFIPSGSGGSSYFGGGARAVSATAGAAVNGNNGGSYGAGGSGGHVNSLVGTAAGGNGSTGVVVITEFCSQA